MSLNTTSKMYFFLKILFELFGLDGECPQIQNQNQHQFFFLLPEGKMYKQYTDRDLLKAVAAVISGELSIPAASTRFSVPRSTLFFKSREDQQRRLLKQGGKKRPNKKSAEKSTEKSTENSKTTPRKRRSMYKQYTQEDLQNAIMHVTSKNMTHRAAAALYKIPPSTLELKIREHRITLRLNRLDESGTSETLSNSA